MTDLERARRRDHRRGLLYALGAFAIWGAALPVYLKIIGDVPVLEILAHRIVWAAPFAWALVILFGQRHEMRRLLTPRVFLLLSVSAMLITINWGTYILAVTTGRIVETSLGYFMSPLVSVVLGMGLLGERLRRLQLAACLVAAAGVAIFMIAVGGIPWIALGVGLSFSLYGLVRKVVAVESLVGFTFEAAVLTPFAGAYLLWLGIEGKENFSVATPLIDGLLIFGGILTAVPLIWFAAAARKLPLSTTGLIQFAAPSLTFLLGVFVYGEPFTMVEAITFACIWFSLALYSLDAVSRRGGTLDAGAPAD